MSCMTSLTTYAHEEPAFTSAASKELNPRSDALRKRRRHSSYQVRPWSDQQENVQLLVEDFLESLNHRLDFIETYGQLKLDEGIERAYSTLQAVRESCSHVSDEVIGAGRRRGKIIVDTLEDHYKGVLTRKETLDQKVQEGVKMMEKVLTAFEIRAYVERDSKFAAAGDLFEEGWRMVDEGLERAKAGAKEVVDDGMEVARRAKEAMKHSVDEAINLAREHGLITYSDLPDPWKVNPHIVRGYRFNETKVECFRSICALSNEAFNIWSHLIGLFMILAIAFYLYPSSSNFSLSTKSDIFIASVFFFAACKCLVCSTLWHTMSSISNQSLMERFACVDYTGISLLVATSIMTTEYTAFYCQPVSRWTYMSLTAILGIGGTILPWHPKFNRADMSWARVGFYVSLACTGFLPVFQISWERGLPWAMYFYAPITKSILVYFIGAVLYAGKIPERWFPGMFDYVGGSHNIWHVAVLGGILFHYSAMQSFFSHAFQMAREGECSVY